MQNTTSSTMILFGRTACSQCGNPFSEWKAIYMRDDMPFCSEYCREWYSRRHYRQQQSRCVEQRPAPSPPADTAANGRRYHHLKEQHFAALQLPDTAALLNRIASALVRPQWLIVASSVVPIVDGNKKSRRLKRNNKPKITSSPDSMTEESVVSRVR